MTIEKQIETLQMLWSIIGIDNCTLNESFTTALESMRKQIPREHEIRVNRCHQKEIYCPNCNRYHGLYGAPSMDVYSKFCPWCGQALDMRYAE